MQKKVLVVEDNDMNRRLIATLVRSMDMELIEAVNGDEGVKRAREIHPDLVLMDIQMPVMDGFTAIRILKSDPATSDMKIIALTAFAMKGDKEKILESGCDGYLPKPIDVRRFAEEIGKYL